MSYNSPPPPRRDSDRTDRFTRGGFAPLPHRHDFDGPGSGSGYGAPADRYIPPPPPPQREPLPVRERDLLSPVAGAGSASGGGGGGAPRRAEEYDADVSRWERRLDRERDRDEWEERDWERNDRADRGVGGPPGGDRGRRPPPHWEEDFDRPKRRRSPSPGHGHGFPSHRPRRFSPDPHAGAFSSQSVGPTIALGSNLPDPASLPNQLSFKQFADWFRASHPSTAKADEEEFRRWKAGIYDGIDGAGESGGRGEGFARVGMGKRYERYRKEYTSRQLYALYLLHRASPWFSERYSQTPTDIAQRRRVNRQGRIPTAEKYLDELKSGKHDSVSYDQADELPAKRPSAPVGERSSTSRRYSELEEPDGLDRALGEESAEPGKLEIPPKANQVFVKSVPPSISRAELEQLFSSCDGFQYLALTEPSVKKAFHRVAWAQYSVEADIDAVVKKLDESKIDNFIFHMGVNVAPTVGRIRFTPPSANTLSRLLLDGEKAQALALKLEEELLGDDEGEAELEVEVKPDAEGNSTVKIEGDGAMSPEAEKDQKAKTAGKANLTGMRESGSVIVSEVLGRLFEAGGLDGEMLSEEQQLKKAKITLDHWISYLRNGLSTCYYCVAPMSFPEELQRKCVGHLRSPGLPLDSGKDDLDIIHEDRAERPERGGDNAEGDTKADLDTADKDDEGERDQRDAGENGGAAGTSNRRDRDKDRDRQGGRGRNSDERWEENLDLKLAPIIGEVDLVEFGGRNAEEETRKLTAPHIKQEEASKYRCKECNKLFKAPEFVVKHITVKHGEHVQAKLDELATFNAFVLDPQHLQPTAQVPAAIDDALPQMGMGVPLMNPAFTSGSGSTNSALPNNPQQQMMFMMMQMQQAMMMQMANGGGGGVAMGPEGRGLAGRMGGYANGGPGAGGREREPLPPTPAGAEDPRAKRGRVSYMDLDDIGGGTAGGGGGGGGGGAVDGGLPY